MINSLTTPTAARLLAVYRAANPRSRAVSLVKLVRNTSATKQYGCVLCGAEGPSFCARYPETKRSIDWCLAHAAEHVAQADAESAADVNLGALAIAYYPQAVAA